MMFQLLITIGSSILVVSSFIFRENQKELRCYELELETCFREAFLSSFHLPIINNKKRDVAMLANTGNTTVLDKRKRELHVTKKSLDVKKLSYTDARQIQVCHDVRKFSACFLYPGCTDQIAADIAVVQYHLVFGKKLPKNVFLAYRGYGTQLCEQQCATASLSCDIRSPEDRKDEQSYSLELKTLMSHIQPAEKDVTTACTRFKIVLVNLLRIRRRYCGELAKCTCYENAVLHNKDGCNTGCENFLNMDLEELSEALSSSSLPTFFSIFVVVVIFLMGFS